MPADDFFRLLPDWCGQFQDKIHRGCFWSTEAVAHKLRLLVQRRLALSVEDTIPCMSRTYYWRTLCVGASPCWSTSCRTICYFLTRTPTKMQWTQWRVLQPFSVGGRSRSQGQILARIPRCWIGSAKHCWRSCEGGKLLTWQPLLQQLKRPLLRHLQRCLPHCNPVFRPAFSEPEKHRAERNRTPGDPSRRKNMTLDDITVVTVLPGLESLKVEVELRSTVTTFPPYPTRASFRERIRSPSAKCYLCRVHREAGYGALINRRA
ncbi:hypothetical protein K438DRAFT_329655 [Mycena galopus ATCC 62051]|nr:hypothetical protein K438DRAFT_329655 [Mycena galopus ATCC 62051]